MPVMGFGLACVGLIVKDDVEVRVQVFYGLGERGRGGHRPVDQNDGVLRGIRAVELSVNSILPLNVEHSDFGLHHGSDSSESSVCQTDNAPRL